MYSCQRTVAESQVTSLRVATGAGGDPITDVDIGAVEGIAITFVDNSNGTWEYSTDGGSTPRIRVSALGWKFWTMISCR